MWRKGLAVAVTALLAFAQEAPIRREGAHWVQVVTGSIAIPPDCRLKVDSRGPVTLRGQATDRVTYTVKKRVRARSEAEARKLLQAANVRATARNGLAVIAFTPRLGPAVSGEMELSSRHDLQSVILATSGGDVQVYDIQGTVHADTGGGLIQMDRIGSDAVANTGGGEIRFGAIGGSIRCVSGGGSIQVDRVGRESWLETAGGDIFVRETGGPIHTTTAGGNIQIQRAAAMVSARTSGGRIEVLHAKGSCWRITPVVRFKSAGIRSTGSFRRREHPPSWIVGFSPRGDRCRQHPRGLDRRNAGFDSQHGSW